MVRRSLLAIFIGVLPLLSHSQEMLSKTEQDIKKEFPTKKFTSGFNAHGERWIRWTDEATECTYYFAHFGFANGNTHCDFCIIAPKTTEFLNFLVELYNNKYVIVSKTKWLRYSSDGIEAINLFWDASGAFFTYNEVKGS